MIIMDNLDRDPRRTLDLSSIAVPALSSSNSTSTSSKGTSDIIGISIPAPPTSRSTSSHSGKPNISGILKVEKVGPIFRIVNKYEAIENAKIEATKQKIQAKRAAEDAAISEEVKRKRGDLYAEDSGVIWHKISNPMISRPIITENLPLQFKDLPITGAPECSERLEEYQDKKIREFVGGDLDDTEFAELENYCNPDVLQTSRELKMATRVPVPGLISKNRHKDCLLSDDETSESEAETEPEQELHILKRLKMRQERDENNTYARCLKYRGVKLLPLSEQEDNIPGSKSEPPDLEPGKDILFRIRVYRPFTFHLTGEKHVRGRHSVFNCDIVMLGRQKLTALRDRFACRNDVDMRLDMSDRPDDPPTASAKEVFPSGFLFINNVFYVDGRARCGDLTAALRRWAAARGLGDFPVRRMEHCRLDQILIKLAHPEVYVHQGSCEHVFLFSEVRLLARADPPRAAAYPRHCAVSQNQTIYCTTCAEFGAKWLVTGTCRVPFDPAFFCEVCFKQYLYVDNRKIGQFKAYAYRGNELNLKSIGKSVINYL